MVWTAFSAAGTVCVRLFWDANGSNGKILGSCYFGHASPMAKVRPRMMGCLCSG